MCIMFHIRVVHFFGTLKRKVIKRNIYVHFHKKKSFPGLPNLGAQIRCPQNRYNTVQTDLKYPLFRVNLKMKKPKLWCCFTWIVFAGLNLLIIWQNFWKFRFLFSAFFHVFCSYINRLWKNITLIFLNFNLSIQIIFF